MQTALIHIATLKAANLFASTEATRYYLAGVLVEVTPSHVTYCATNGHIIFAARREVPEDGEPNTLIGQWIIPAATISALKPTREQSLKGVVSLTSLDRASFTLADAMMFKPVDGTFPDWRRVCPTKYSGTMVGFAFNTSYLHTITKAGEVLSGRKTNGYGVNYTLTPNGDGPALCRFHGDVDAFACIMPLRDSTLSLGAPAPWFSHVAGAGQSVAQAA